MLHWNWIIIQAGKQEKGNWSLALSGVTVTDNCYQVFWRRVLDSMEYFPSQFHSSMIHRRYQISIWEFLYVKQEFYQWATFPSRSLRNFVFVIIRLRAAVWGIRQDSLPYQEETIPFGRMCSLWNQAYTLPLPYLFLLEHISWEEKILFCFVLFLMWF